MNSERLRERFPAWNSEVYPDGFLETEAGYAESGRVVGLLARRAREIGVRLRENVRFVALDEEAGRVKGIVLENGERISADAVVIAVGAWTPFVLPFTRNFFQPTGHAVFHLQPREPELFRGDVFPVFAADISTTGFYGFPLNGDGVVKIARHGPGRVMSPEAAQRSVTSEEEEQMRTFVASTFPGLADAPIVESRICLYCDTHDGHFWIAPDPERNGLVVAAGDNGHGFKFAPVLGEIIADAVERKSNPLLAKFRWRPEVRAGDGREAARFTGNL
jgi:glycine/D-amino acid oxidase-like deaminating enzyme